MARVQKTKPVVDKQADFYQSYLDNIDTKLDQLESQHDLHGAQNFKAEDKTTFGLLSLDLITKGGIVPGGWYTFFGGEQSAKSTLAQTVLANAATSNVPILGYADYEGSYSQDYFKNIGFMAGCDMSLDEYFGLKKGKDWLIKPRIRQYSTAIAEQFFDWLAGILIHLPRKRYSDGQWWLIFEDNKENRSFVGTNYDAARSKSNTGDKKMLWVPCEHGGAQALVVVDSYVAMLPEKEDGEDPHAGLAAQARMFAENIKRVKPKMSTRLVTVMGINQVRKKIGFVMGSPESEPGGEALKFFSDVRVRCAQRSTANTKNGIEQEEALDGGTDLYGYVHMSTRKNKLGGIPNSEIMARVWKSDSKGEAFGYDPVYDCFTFLKETGCIEGTKNKLYIHLPEFNGAEHAPLSWMDFKTLVIGTKDQMGAVLDSIGVEKSNFSHIADKRNLLRSVCRQYLNNGQAFDWYYENRLGGGGTIDEGSEEDDAAEPA